MIKRKNYGIKYGSKVSRKSISDSNGFQICAGQHMIPIVILMAPCGPKKLCILESPHFLGVEILRFAQVDLWGSTPAQTGIVKTTC